MGSTPSSMGNGVLFQDNLHCHIINRFFIVNSVNLFIFLTDLNWKDFKIKSQRCTATGFQEHSYCQVQIKWMPGGKHGEKTLKEQGSLHFKTTFSLKNIALYMLNWRWC